MKIRSQKAFTLVELLIVTSMIVVLSGLGAKFWFVLERSANAINQNLAFYTESELIVQRLVEDIRKAETLIPPEAALLKLCQIDAKGRRIEVIYTLHENELIRTTQCLGREETSLKIATISPERLTIESEPQGWIRIKLERASRERPLQAKTRRLISYARPLGVR